MITWPGSWLPNAFALLKGLSLANVCFVNLWYHILTTNPARYYTLAGPASRQRMAAAVANVVTLAVVLTAAFRVDTRAPWMFAVARSAIACVAVLQAAMVYRTVHDASRRLRRWHRALLGRPGRSRGARLVLLTAIAVACGVAAFDVGIRRALGIVADLVAVAGIPLLPVTLGRAVRFAIRGHPLATACASDRRVVTPHPSTTDVAADAEVTSRAAAARARVRPRVVWLLFDELDYALPFERRPLDLALPAFDGLRATAFWCEHALPPAHCTELSVPALLSGLRVAGTWPQTPSDLAILVDGADGRIRWSEQETVFTRARAVGAQSAIVGRYHPYGRVLRGHADRCVWFDDRTPAFSVRDGFAGAYVDQYRGLFETPRYSLFGQSLTVRKAVREYAGIQHEAEAALADPALDLIYVHASVPHSPYIYDPDRRTLDAANRGPAGYLDNVVLADRLLADCLAAAAASVRASETVFLVTSDHWWRASAGYDGVVDHRVPFAVHWPQDGGGTRWTAPFETVHACALVLALLTGEVRTRGDLVEWLGGGESVGPLDGLDAVGSAEHGTIARPTHAATDRAEPPVANCEVRPV